MLSVMLLQRNYRWFLCFVFSTTLLCVWVFTLSLVQLLKYTDQSGRDFGHAIRKYPASLVCIIYSFLAFWCVLQQASSCSHMSCWTFHRQFSLLATPAHEYALPIAAHRSLASFAHAGCIF